MNREIKFRVFRITTKELFHPRSIEWNWNDGQMEIGMKSVSGTATIPTAPADEFIIMQYTGLKDKNGKEIYEGDIIRMNDACDFEVTFLGCAFVAKALDSEPVLYNKGGHYNIVNGSEVIGNIFETNNQ